MSNVKEIIKILKESSYHPEWGNDNSYFGTNEKFVKAVNEGSIKYFKPLMKCLFINDPTSIEEVRLETPPKLSPNSKSRKRIGSRSHSGGKKTNKNKKTRRGNR